MYNYSELEAMDNSQLREVAESNGIKKINLEDKENLVYEILDKQARDVAAATSSAANNRGRKNKKDNKEENAPKAVEQPSEQTPKRRGRKPKNQATTDETATADEGIAATQEKTTQDDIVAEPSTLEPQQSQGEQQPKRRRGRPPRNPQNEEDAAITTTEEKPSESLSKESEQPTVFTQPEQPLALPTHLETDNKQPENETAGQTSEQQTDERPRHGVFIRPGKPTETIVQASDIENNPQQKRDFRPKDSSFGSFFPRSGGRTFAPCTYSAGYADSPTAACSSDCPW